MNATWLDPEDYLDEDGRVDDEAMEADYLAEQGDILRARRKEGDDL